MRVRVRFLANYRELVGSNERLFEQADGANVGMLLDELFQQFPSLIPHSDEMLVSVNKAQASRRQVLHEGDEMVLLPPAVGG